VSPRTDAAFAALVDLDPVRGALGPSAESESEAACLARIIATSRSGPEVTARVKASTPPARRAPQWSTPARGRSRYGAIGLVASAAIAVIATVLWASPSAGSPPDQAATIPVQVGQMHSSAHT
jgi:hypothetical protein